MDGILWQFIVKSIVIFRTLEICSTVDAPLTLASHTANSQSSPIYLIFKILICALSAALFLLLLQPSPLWRAVLLPLPLLQHCHQTRFVCSSAIFISSLSSSKISLGLHNQVHNLSSGTRSCLNLPLFHHCIPRSPYFQTETFVLITLLLLTLCFSLKCPLPCPFLYLDITTLSKLSSDTMSFPKACH